MPNKYSDVMGIFSGSASNQEHHLRIWYLLPISKSHKDRAFSGHTPCGGKDKGSKCPMFYFPHVLSISPLLLSFVMCVQSF